MRILHVFRTPLGGLFRHVRDLARGQQARGHDAGILCDSLTGGSGAPALLQTAEAFCSLGIKRIPISRLPGLGDLSGIAQTASHARQVKPDIIHCHGAKGGLYGRVAARVLGLRSVYTPHGGSLHYAWQTPQGLVFLGAERLLARIGGGFHFVCEFEKHEFGHKIGIGRKPASVIYNGLWPDEFASVEPDPDATDILFAGELRHLKGVDLLIEAIHIASARRTVTATLVGDGPDGDGYRSMVASCGLSPVIRFAGRMPFHKAIRLGRIMVIPSRAESFPYIVLETIAAGRPIIASAVGGIPEILPPEQLVTPGDATALANRIAQAIEAPERQAVWAAANQQRIKAQFSADAMVDGALALYTRVLGT